jgi:hypothetical protein
VSLTDLLCHDDIPIFRFCFFSSHPKLTEGNTTNKLVQKITYADIKLALPSRGSGLSDIVTADEGEVYGLKELSFEF